MAGDVPRARGRRRRGGGYLAARREAEPSPPGFYMLCPARLRRATGILHNSRSATLACKRNIEMTPLWKTHSATLLVGSTKAFTQRKKVFLHQAAGFDAAR